MAEIPDLLPPAELLREGPSSENLRLLVAQVGHLERKTDGLLSGRVHAHGMGGFVRFHFILRIPAIEGYEAVLFMVDRDPTRASSPEDLAEVRAAFQNADVVRSVRNAYAHALSLREASATGG